MTQQPETGSELVNLKLPADLAAIIAAAANTALAESDTVPFNVATVIAAAVLETVPNATSITITGVVPQTSTRRLRYRKRPPSASWSTQGRVDIMSSHTPKT